jgi:hypothetical protein
VRLRVPAPADLDRVLHAPQAAVHTAGRLTHGALDNARRSLEEISRSVSDRRSLQDQLEQGGEPGDLQVIDPAECLSLLATRSVGRLAYLARAATPDVVPVNYVLTDGKVLIRSGSGPKLQAAQRRDLVAFEVDEIDEQSHCGWSVVVTGRLTVVPFDKADAADLPSPWANGPRRHLMRLDPARVTGRRLL